MSKFYTLLCLLASFFLFNNAYPQDRKIERKVYFDSSAKSYFRYIKDPSYIDYWTIEKLLNDQKTKNGPSIEYFLLKENEMGDTLKLVSFYKKGIAAPLWLTVYSGQKGLVEHFGENMATNNHDPWRDALYRVYTKGLEDSMQLYYLRERDTIFTEDYYLGYRHNRTIRNKAVFDSLYLTTQTPGAKIFYVNCSSCHNPYKDATGPKLAGVTKRRSEAWLRKWIRNSVEMIYNKDPEGLSLREQWQVMMPAFPMSDTEMDKLMDFLKTL